MSDRADDVPPVRDEPLVSVIMPVRNGAADVANAVRCVLGQTWECLELIVIDDGSEDETHAVLAAFGDRRVRVVMAALPEPLYRWRRHDGSTSALHHRAQVASTEQIQAGLWRRPPDVLAADEIREGLLGYRREPACGGALTDRFLQVQLAVAFQACRRRHMRLAVTQVAAVVRADRSALPAIVWFVVTGGRHVSRRSVTARLLGRHR